MVGILGRNGAGKSTLLKVFSRITTPTSGRAVLRGRPVVMLLSEVASHYGLALSRKVALQMMPVAGALCGAAGASSALMLAGPA